VSEQISNKATKLVEQVALFSSLPDCANVALPVVCALLGRSPASIWRDVKAGRCPAPAKVGPRSTRWNVGELRKSLGA
jgi:predicted DNA-binding transcriptional regulator AlpA